MATLSTLLAPELALTGSCWRLRTNANGYKRALGNALVTQASNGRSFRILERRGSRLWIQLLEDGYRCWFELEAVLGRAEQRSPWRPALLPEVQIASRLPAVLAWTERAEQQANTYLWGGTTEPDMDCSGLMQMAFASQGIWIPRDAYQQERHCQPVAVAPDAVGLLRPGDLIFFGSPRRCTHVGLHLGRRGGSGGGSGGRAPWTSSPRAEAPSVVLERVISKALLSLPTAITLSVKRRL